MAIVIGTTVASVAMYGMLKTLEIFLKSKGIELEDYE